MFKNFLVIALLIFVKLNFVKCGGKIIGGQEVKDASEFPYMCSLLVKYRNQGVDRWFHLCGGAVIHYKFILTAGHCATYAKRK